VTLLAANSREGPHMQQLMCQQLGMLTPTSTTVGAGITHHPAWLHRASVMLAEPGSGSDQHMQKQTIQCQLFKQIKGKPAEKMRFKKSTAITTTEAAPPRPIMDDSPPAGGSRAVPAAPRSAAADSAPSCSPARDTPSGVTLSLTYMTPITKTLLLPCPLHPGHVQQPTPPPPCQPLQTCCCYQSWTSRAGLLLLLLLLLLLDVNRQTDMADSS